MEINIEYTQTQPSMIGNQLYGIASTLGVLFAIINLIVLIKYTQKTKSKSIVVWVIWGICVLLNLIYKQVSTMFRRIN